MALSGSFTTTALTEYGCTVSFTFSWTATQSIENNKSLINWSLKTNMNPSTYSRGVRRVYITRDNTQVYNQTWSYDSMHSVTGGTVLASGTNYEIAHDPDGSKSFTFNVSVNVGRSTETSWTNTGSQSVTLNTIPRASTMSLSPADPTTLTQITASVTRATNTFKHTITTSYDNAPYTLSGDNKFDTSVSFYIPDGIRTSMKNNNVSSLVLPLTLTTYSGNTVIGSKDYSLTIKAPVATVSVSSASVACNANITWTLSNVDIKACSYTVTRSYNGTIYYTDKTKSTTTSLSVANSTFERHITQAPASGTITVKVTTYVGTTEVGSNTKDYTCTIPLDYYKPTLSLHTGGNLTRANKVPYIDQSGITFLAGYDGATGSVNEGYANSSHAEIVSRVVTVSGNKATGTRTSASGVATINVNAFNSDAYNYDVVVTYTVTDSRGGSASYDFSSIRVLGYVPPTFSTKSIQRANSSGTPTSEGRYARINVLAHANTVKTSNGGAELNRLKTLTYKLGSTGTEETDGVSYDGLNGTISKLNYYGNGGFDIDEQYIITVTATDILGISNSIELLLPKAVITLSLHKRNGVAVGGPSAANTFDIYLNDSWHTTKTRKYVLAAPNGANGNPSWRRLVESDLPNLSASKINSGTFDTARIPGLAASKITSGTFNVARIPSLSYLPLSGGAMTGQIKTSFKESVAMGSYGTAQTTVAGFVDEVRYSSGCTGSVSIGAAYTNNGITIPSGWYNFIFSPHRTGGLNGAANGDNCNYGTLILNGMTGDFGTFIIRVSGSGVGSLQRVSMSSGCAIAKSTASTITSTTANHFYKITLSSITASGASSLFEIGNGGIKVNKAGKYKVSASCYYQSNSTGCCPSVYVRSSTGTISDSSSTSSGMGTELGGISIPATTVAMPVVLPPMLVDLRANTYLYLVARPRQATTGGIVCGNTMTYLQVEYEG